MAISRAWYVSCDGCGDPAPINTWSAVGARATAQDAGYVRARRGTRMMDLCPRCVEKLAIEEADRG